MKLHQFLSSSVEISPISSKEKTKVTIIWGGSASARTYVLRLLEKRFNAPDKVVFYLPEVEKALWKLFLMLPNTLQVIFWGPNTLDEDIIAKMLIDFGALPQKTIILDATDEVRNAWGRKDVPRTSLRRQIDCNLPLSEPDSMTEIYTRWFEEVEHFDVSPKLLSHAIDRPFSESFNMVQVLKLVGEKNLNLVTAQKFGLLWTDEEQFFVDSLINKGRSYAMKTNWSGLNEGRALYLLYLRVHMLLQVKTLQVGYLRDRLAKLNISKAAYFALEKTAKNQELKSLYKRLYLVLSLLKWRNQKGVLNLLMLYW